MPPIPKVPNREFIGGPWDGMGAPVDHENVFYDSVGRAHILVCPNKTVIGDYELDLTVAPPVWRWTRSTDDDKN